MTDTTLPARELFTIEAKVDEPPAQVVSGPLGTRVIVSVSAGTFKGDRLAGTVALITDDGVRIYVTYNGVGTPNADGTLSLRTAPTFEAPEGPYAWLNNVQAVGIGESNPAGGSLRYEVFEVL